MSLIEKMIQSRELSPAARDMDPFDVLCQWAETNAVEFVNVTTKDGTDVYGWSVENDGITRRIVLVNGNEWHDIVLYFDTTDKDLLASIQPFVDSGILSRPDGLDEFVLNLSPAE